MQHVIHVGSSNSRVNFVLYDFSWGLLVPLCSIFVSMVPLHDHWSVPCWWLEIAPTMKLYTKRYIFFFNLLSVKINFSPVMVEIICILIYLFHISACKKLAFSQFWKSIIVQRNLVQFQSFFLFFFSILLDDKWVV